MTIHSSFLAWRIQRTEEPDDCSPESQRVSNVAHIHRYMYGYIHRPLSLRFLPYPAGQAG